VISVGRLDVASEGLLLLTNDGGLARHLELPVTGWIRRYRVRAFGRPDRGRLAALAAGVTIAGVAYGPIRAAVDREQGANVWLTVSLAEGKNREVRRVLEHLGLEVNRLIRTAFGPFQLGALKRRALAEVSTKVMREQLGAEGRRFAPKPLRWSGKAR
jgi:23S rRNA pseudouridine2605 synthase